MTVSTFVRPNPTTQLVTEYLSSVDGDIDVMSRVAAAFAPHQSEPAALTVTVDGGPLFDGSLTEIAAQTTPAIPVPVAHPRIDRVVIDRTSGAITVVSGTESATPTPPAIPAGMAPIARIQLDPPATAITNAMIADERAFLPIGVSAGGGLIDIRRFTADGIYTPTPGTKSIIVEVQGAGGGGGGCAAPGTGRSAVASGGGSGAFIRSRLTSGFAGTVVKVGAGGAPSAAAAVNGNPGEDSSFGSLVAFGGRPGLAGPIVIPPSFTYRGGNTAEPTGGNISNDSGRTGGEGLTMTPTSVAGGTGGTTLYGAGSVGSHNGAGPTTTNPGTGGGGASSIAGDPARSGGGGAPGLVTVYEYA